MKVHELVAYLLTRDQNKHVVLYDENNDVLLDLTRAQDEYDEYTDKDVIALYAD